MSCTGGPLGSTATIAFTTVNVGNVPLSANGTFPANIKSVAYVGILEEYRFYVREVHAKPSDLTTEVNPRLSRARFYAGSDNPWNADPTNLYQDIAEGVLDLQIALGFDLNGDGVIGVPAAASSGLQPATPTIAPPTITIAPSSGNAVLCGSAASDTFVFGPHFGNDTIVNFQLGTDQVNVDHTLFASLSDMLFHTANNANGNAVITVTTDQSITIEDASKQLLQQHLTDFHLV